MFRISIKPEEIEGMPLGSFPGEIHVISQPGLEFNKAIFYLRRQKILGFDTETRPVFAPGQKNHGVALLQLSGPDKAYLFRVQTLGMGKLLSSVLSNRNIIKVGAAVHDDVRGLQRLGGFEARNFIDLQKIGWEWGIRDKSVKKMAAIILGCRISKAQQLSNWEADELSDSQQMYAATDAWICREMYLKLLESEKNPLTPEQINPPQPPKPVVSGEEAIQQADAQKQQSGGQEQQIPKPDDQASAGTETAKKKRKKHRHKRKPKIENDQDNTQERQG